MGFQAWSVSFDALLRRRPEEKTMFRKILIAATLAATASVGFGATADAKSHGPKNGFVIADGDTGRVLYDDGNDDAFCVTRRRFVGFDWYGEPIFRRVTRCR
jgi:hypothetical protein